MRFGTQPVSAAGYPSMLKSPAASYLFTKLNRFTWEHSWALGSCHHGPLVEPREKDWIDPNSEAHQKLRELILDARWLKDVPKYLHFRWVRLLLSTPFMCALFWNCWTDHFFPPQINRRTWIFPQSHPHVRQQTFQLHTSSVQFTSLSCGSWLQSPHQQGTKKKERWHSSV